MPKMGYWMKTTHQIKGAKYKCSECGKNVYYIGGGIPTKCLYPYCPYCKAKMNIER